MGIEQIVQHAYLGIMLLLVLGACGLPIPEDVVIFAAGGLAYRGVLHWWPAWLTCYLTVLTVDTVVFFLGRRFGTRVLHWRWVKRLAHPRRLLWWRRQVQQHGAWMIMAGRFLPGVRGPTLLFAGSLRLARWKYILAECPALLVSVTAEFLAGYFVVRSFGSEAGPAERIVTFGLMALGLLIVILFALWRWRAHRRSQTGSPEHNDQRPRK